MSADPLTTADPPPRELPPAWTEFADAPLVPFALAASAGLIADRYVGVPFDAALLASGAAVVAWFALQGRSPIAIGLLWFAVAGAAAAHHHGHRHRFPPDDIGAVADETPHPVKLRGVILEEPILRKRNPDPLAPIHRTETESFLLEVNSLAAESSWRSASGVVQVRVERDPEQPFAVRCGGTVEVVGQLSRPRPPGSPGERDATAVALDKQLRGEVRVSNGPAGVVRIAAGGWSLSRAIAVVRGYGTRVLKESLPTSDAGVARALLLGDGSGMERAEWEAFVRTGVVHVLVISGQHLAILGGVVWFLCLALAVPNRRAAWVVAAVVVAYAVVTGLRPSSTRAAVMVSAVCGAVILRRPMHTANSFALAWLVVLMFDPTEPFDLGCRLSFLSVFVLVWGCSRWLKPRPLSPLDQLIDESRPPWVRTVRAVGRAVFGLFAVNAILTAVNAPLLMAEVNVVSPVSLLVGPLLVLVSSVALVAGFALLLVAPIPLLNDAAALVTRFSLQTCDALVNVAADVPGGSVYVCGLPAWWLVGLYLLVAGVVLVKWNDGKRLLAGLAIWLVVAFVIPDDRPADELRVAFLSVGHGACVVLETPDGRCLMYDAGTTTGPDAVRRVIAPYLWHRGHRRIDELFLSHADADHFNGIDELLKRFAVGRVTMTPSFAEKPTAEVAAGMLAVRKRGVEVRVAVAGDRFTAGDVALDVLHPPPGNFGTVENERSLVLLVRHAGHSILLTGDLEKAGTGRVLGLPPVPADVLLAPHHGSAAAFPDALRRWATPKLVAVSRGNLYSNTVADGIGGPGVPVWDTHTFGTVTVRSHRSGLVADTFRTGESRVIVRGGR